jgi:hypothetical protein
LSVQFPGEPARQLVPESIYQALHSRELCLNRRLRSGRPYPSRRCPRSGYLILGVLCVRAIATGMVGRRWGCLVTGWAGKIVWAWCGPRVLRCWRPAGWGSLVSPGARPLPLAGTLVPVALVAQGIEQRFPNELLRSRP